jgi:hypothetical protein
MTFHPTKLVLATLLASAFASSISIADSTYPQASLSRYTSGVATIEIGPPKAFCAKMLRYCLEGNQNACQNYQEQCVRGGGIDIIRP